MYTNYVGIIGEDLVREELRRIKGSIISGFIRSKNINFYVKNFQIDFLIFAPKVGLITLEVKNWYGEVRATSEDKWKIKYGSEEKEYNNASLQVLRTVGLLLHILEKGKINKWPIRPVIVFVNKNAKILRSKYKEPQTDIILISMIEDWIKENSTEELSYSFTTEEFEKVKKVICEYTSGYIESN